MVKLSLHPFQQLPASHNKNWKKRSGSLGRSWKAQNDPAGSSCQCYPLVIRHSCGKSPSLMWKSTISMAIFHSELWNYIMANMTTNLKCFRCSTVKTSGAKANLQWFASASAINFPKARYRSGATFSSKPGEPFLVGGISPKNITGYGLDNHPKMAKKLTSPSLGPFQVLDWLARLMSLHWKEYVTWTCHFASVWGGLIYA